MARIYLVIDGNKAEAARTAQQLRAVEPGCEVLGASDGPEALALLEERRVVPSLIFADFSMPSMNGIEFLGSVRMRRWLESVPVAMLTSPVPDKHIVTCYRLGVSAFLTKPVAMHELREVIREKGRLTRRLDTPSESAAA